VGDGIPGPAYPGNSGAGATAADRWFLPWGYREATPCGGERNGTDQWEVATVHRWVARRRAWRTATLLVDTVSGAEDPAAVLARLRADVLATGTGAVVVELDRDSLDEPVLGPPSGRRARRHWSAEGLVLLAESAGFTVVRRASLPAQPGRWTPLRRGGPCWTVLALRPTSDSR
jgi:hypothetical protein